MYITPITQVINISLLTHLVTMKNALTPETCLSKQGKYDEISFVKSIWLPSSDITSLCNVHNIIIHITANIPQKPRQWEEIRIIERGLSLTLSRCIEIPS